MGIEPRDKRRTKEESPKMSDSCRLRVTHSSSPEGLPLRHPRTSLKLKLFYCHYNLMCKRIALQISGIAFIVALCFSLNTVESFASINV